jgi:hypothetical protein
MVKIQSYLAVMKSDSPTLSHWQITILHSTKTRTSTTNCTKSSAIYKLMKNIHVLALCVCVCLSWYMTTESPWTHQNDLPLDPILNQFNSFHIQTKYFRNVHFNIILIDTCGSLKCSLSVSLSNHNFAWNFSSSFPFLALIGGSFIKWPQILGW